MIKIKLIAKGRGYGKTCELIMKSAETGVPIVTLRNPECIVNMAKNMRLNIVQPMSLNQYDVFRKNGSLVNSELWKGEVLIDDVDEILEEILGAKVKYATYTPELDAKEELFKREYMCKWVELKEERERCMKEEKLFDAEFIPRDTVTDVNVIVPNKVVEVTFSDGTKEKAVCREPDVFSLEHAIAICISKHVMGGSNKYNNAVNKGMKVYKGKLKREEEKKKEEERISKRRDKREAYKKRRAEKIAKVEREMYEKEREELIEIQKEAYIRALKEVNKNSVTE